MCAAASPQDRDQSAWPGGWLPHQLHDEKALQAGWVRRVEVVAALLPFPFPSAPSLLPFGRRHRPFADRPSAGFV